jgi:hypothetical protein
MDMLQFFERAFNPQLCEELAKKSDEHLCKPNQVFISGVWYPFKGDTICAAQVLALTRRDWCNPDYKVFYTDQAGAPQKELKQGQPVRITPLLAFFVKKDDKDTWAEQELARVFVTRERAIRSLARL